MTTTLNKTFICGSVKNCEKYLPYIFDNIAKIIPLFSDFHIIMSIDSKLPSNTFKLNFSNNNIDNSLNVLKSIQSSYKHKMDILINTNTLSNIRVERISNSRNRILNKIKEIILVKHDFNYFIMLDCDNVCATKINPEVLSKYMNRNDWDALSFNRRDYYDIWALSFNEYMYSCWNFSNSNQVIKNMKHEIQHELSVLSPDKLLQCHSAFNGFAIYRVSKFINCQYNWVMDLSYFTKEIMIQNMTKTKSIPIKREPNQDCEHRLFHFQAIRKNNAQIMISPLYLFE